DCRQCERFVDAVVNAIIRRIDRQVRRKCDVNPVESQPRLVNRTSSEGMGFTEREHLALSSAGVSEARDGLQILRRRLDATVSLVRVIGMQQVVAGKPMTDIKRVLVIRDGGNCGTTKCTRTTIRPGYELQQVLDDRIGHRGSLSIR